MRRIVQCICALSALSASSQIAAEATLSPSQLNDLGCVVALSEARDAAIQNKRSDMGAMAAQEVYYYLGRLGTTMSGEELANAFTKVGKSLVPPSPLEVNRRAQTCTEGLLKVLGPVGSRMAREP